MTMTDLVFTIVDEFEALVQKAAEPFKWEQPLGTGKGKVLVNVKSIDEMKEEQDADNSRIALPSYSKLGR